MWVLTDGFYFYFFMLVWQRCGEGIFEGGVVAGFLVVEKIR